MSYKATKKQRHHSSIGFWGMVVIAVMLFKVVIAAALVLSAA